MRHFLGGNWGKNIIICSSCKKHRLAIYQKIKREEGDATILNTFIWEEALFNSVKWVEPILEGGGCRGASFYSEGDTGVTFMSVFKS